VLSGWPVHRLIAGAARPGRMPAAVTEASLITHQSLVRAELVAVRAVRRWPSDPRAHGGLHEVAQRLAIAYGLFCCFCACSRAFRLALMALRTLRGAYVEKNSSCSRWLMYSGTPKPPELPISQ
jgi:hypothetical protein